MFDENLPITRVNRLEDGMYIRLAHEPSWPSRETGEDPVEVFAEENDLAVVVSHIPRSQIYWLEWEDQAEPLEYLRFVDRVEGDEPSFRLAERFTRDGRRYLHVEPTLLFRLDAVIDRLAAFLGHSVEIRLEGEVMPGLDGNSRFEMTVDQVCDWLRNHVPQYNGEPISISGDTVDMRIFLRKNTVRVFPEDYEAVREAIAAEGK